MNRRSLLAAAAAVSVAGCVGAGGSPGGSGAGSDGADGDDGDGDAPEDGDGDDGDGDAPEDDDANTTEAVSEGGPETAADPELQSTELLEADGEPVADSGEAAIEFAAGEVAVAGTIVGETGCHSAEIAGVTVDDEGAFHVVVAAVDRSAPDRLCTQSLTPVGYELEAQFEGGVPETVAVVHDDARGRETVATDRPDGA